MTETAATEGRIGRNAAYSFISQAWLIGLNFLSIPLILRYLGPDAFGVWITVSVVSGYFTILDFGFTRSVVKFTADHWTRGEMEEAESVIRSANLLFLVLGAVGGLAVAATGFALTRWVLHIPNQLQATASLAFGIAAVSFFVNVASTPLSAIPMAIQRFEYVSARLILTATLTTTGSVSLLIAGSGLVALLAYTAVVNAVVAIAFAVLVSERLLPGLDLRPRLNMADFVRLARFSAFKFVSNVSDQVVFQVDRLLVAVFLPIAAVTYYSVPAVIVQRILPFGGLVTNAAFPAMSGSAAIGDRDGARRIYLRSARMASLMILPVCLFCGLMAPAFLSVWIGRDMANHSARTLEVFAAASFVASLAGAPAMANEALGKPQLTAAFALLSAAINLTLNLIFIPLWGFEGAAWALLANGCLQVPVFVAVTNRGLGIPNRVWLRHALLEPAAAGLVASFVLIAVRLMTGELVAVIAGGGSFLAAYAFAAYGVALADPKRAAISTFLKEALRTCRSVPLLKSRSTTRIVPTAVAGGRTPDA